MKKILILLLFLIPIALAQNITTTTGQLPMDYTIPVEITNLNENDTINIESDDWITLENDTITIEGTNYSFQINISIPIIEEGNYTKKIYYNATGFSGFEIPINIEIINDTDTYQTFLENEEKQYLDCIIRKMREDNEINNTTKRQRAEYECRYEVTDNPNGTIAIRQETIIEEKPVLDEETKNKINTLENTTSGINTEITNLKTDISNFKTELLNRINTLEENVSNTINTKETTTTGINWTVLILIVGIAVLIMIGTGFYLMKKKQNQNEGLQPTERVSKGTPLPQKEEPKKQLFKKKDKPEFDRLT